MVKQYVEDKTADQADWLIGEGILRPDVKGVALRNMKTPGTAYKDPVLVSVLVFFFWNKEEMKRNDVAFMILYNLSSFRLPLTPFSPGHRPPA